MQICKTKYHWTYVNYTPSVVFVNITTRKDGYIVRIVDINFNLDIHLAFAQKFICLKSFLLTYARMHQTGKLFLCL